MKVVYLSLSGLRVYNRELLELGLTLPGLTERGKVVETLPNLALLTLAALTPEHWEVEYTEIDKLPDASSLPNADLVAISSYTARIEDAYRLADVYRSRGTKAVLGGLHVTSCPEEAAGHAAAVVVGEAERVWPTVLSDAREGRLCSVYRDPEPGRFDLAASPIPRFDLLDPSRHTRGTLQTHRGCPLDCEFCAASKLYGAGYRQKPLDRVRRELEAIASCRSRPYIELADDNTFCNREYSKNLCRLLGEYGVRWFTETDVSVAEDEELLRLMGSNGCREILVGFESILDSSLDGIDASNWKMKRRRFYRETIDRIQSHGVAVNGCFILGLDGDGPEVFEGLVDFVEQSGLADVQVTILTPFPNTRLYHRLKQEGRLLREKFWSQCTLLDVTFRPKLMTVEQLQEGFRWTVAELFRGETYRRRRRGFIAGRSEALN